MKGYGNPGSLETEQKMDASAATNLDFAFPVPILRRTWADNDKLNAELRDLVLDKAGTSPGVTISNVGGWHSEKNLQDWPEDCVQELVGCMRSMVEEMVRRTVAEPTERHFEGWDLWAWANVNYKGHYNKAHIHEPPYVWSGVYYVDPGDTEPLSGLIKFQDRSGVPKEVVNNPDPFEREITIKPEPGLMLLFPVTVFHHVEPYLGQRPRISIAFDFKHPAFVIPSYMSKRQSWWWSNLPIVMRTGQKIRRRLGLKPLFK